ncbi:MAG: signal transduction histidine kinase [Phenylobacterium sp.]|jgi:signal transduction histidine kinase
MIRLFISFFVMLLVFMIAYQMLGDLAADLWVYKMVVVDKSNDYVGAFYMLEQLYQQLDASGFKQLVANYPDVSNVPLVLFDINQLPIENVSLAPGQIFVADADYDILYYQFINSDLVARLGPMSTYQPLDELVDIYEQLLFVFVGLGVVVWLWLLQLKLSRLDRAAARLGEGDLSVRVSTAGSHKVGNLNQSFNLMAERVETLMKGHKSLTNAVAHELRTPIARIRFQLDMMYDEPDEAQRKEYMYGISDDINELTDLVDELLTYARFDRESPALTMQSNSLDESLQNVIRARHFDSHLTLKYQNDWFASDSKLQNMPFDPKNLERAIGNLLSNAHKYADSKVEIIVEREAKYCQVCIDDDGPGIPEAERADIFIPFKRLDDSRTRATGGYGLGLAIVKQIALWHGGEVRVEQAPIGGARFILQWPLG